MIWSVQRDKRSIVRRGLGMSLCRLYLGIAFMPSNHCPVPCRSLPVGWFSVCIPSSVRPVLWMQSGGWSLGFGAWLKSCISLQRVTTSGGGRAVSPWTITRARAAAWSARLWPWPLQGLLSPSSPGPAVFYSLLRYKSISPHFLTLSLCQPANIQQILRGPMSVCSWVCRRDKACLHVTVSVSEGHEKMPRRDRNQQTSESRRILFPDKNSLVLKQSYKSFVKCSSHWEL